MLPPPADLPHWQKGTRLHPLQTSLPHGEFVRGGLGLTLLALVLLMAAVPLDYGVVLPCSHAGRINGAAK
jgi:hypothetical protein